LVRLKLLRRKIVDTPQPSTSNLDGPLENDKSISRHPRGVFIGDPELTKVQKLANGSSIRHFEDDGFFIRRQLLA
jgi:hypothetical protein